MVMLAGIGTADITPPVGTPLQGHWSRRPQAGAVLYPLEVRSLALRSDRTTLILITADLIGVTLETTRRIRRKIQEQHAVPGAHVILAASHTHCGPAMLPAIGLVPDPAIVDRVERNIVASVADALSNLEPVTLGLGASSAHFNVNRRPFPGTTAMAVNHAGIVDRRVRILRLDRAGGSPLAICFHYACHPTTKNGSDGFISPDYPGVARAFIERELNTHALFLPGCFGNIRPLILSEQGAFASATKEQLDDVGQSLGRAVCSAARFTRTFPDPRLAIVEAELHLPFGPMKPMAELEQMSRLATPAGLALHGPWAQRAIELVRSGASPTGETSIMQACRIGPLELLTLPGEPVQEIGHDLERCLAGRSSACETWPVGYANDQLGYLCTPAMYAEGGYEPNAHVVYDRPAPYADEQRLIVDRAAALDAQLREDVS